MNNSNTAGVVFAFLFGFLLLVGISFTKAEEAPVLPDFTKAPYKLTGWGKDKSHIHPEWGGLNIEIYQNPYEDGIKVSPEKIVFLEFSSIVVFMKNDEQYYAEWMQYALHKQTSVMKLTVYGFFWDASIDAFIFETKKDIGEV